MEIAYELEYIDEKDYKEFEEIAKILSIKLSNYVNAIQDKQG